MATPINYEDWLEKLDKICYANLGCSYRDLHDAAYRDMYEDGLTPSQSYHRILENEE